MTASQNEKNVTAQKFYKRKRFWANIVGLGAAIATAFGVDPGLDTQTQALIVTVIMTVVNTAADLFEHTNAPHA